MGRGRWIKMARQNRRFQEGARQHVNGKEKGIFDRTCVMREVLP